jgi:hypothetical protein
VFVFPADFWSLEDERFTVGDADWNEHTGRAETYADLHLEGQAALAFEREGGGRLVIRDAQVVGIQQLTVHESRPATRMSSRVSRGFVGRPNGHSERTACVTHTRHTVRRFIQTRPVTPGATSEVSDSHAKRC